MTQSEPSREGARLAWEDVGEGASPSSVCAFVKLLQVFDMKLGKCNCFDYLCNLDNS